QIWDLATGEVAFTPEECLPGVNGLVFSPDGKWLAAAVGNFSNGSDSRCGEVRIWDTATWQQVANLRSHAACVWSVSFSPDGRRLASASGQWGRRVGPGEVKIWDLQTVQEVGTLRGHTQGVFGVAFSPDGRRLATAGGDGAVKTWDRT